MGKPKKRVSPRIANQVNRDFERLILLCILGAVRVANTPWECNSIGRPCWNPRIVAVCVFMKISLCKTYDGIEAYLKSNTLVAQRLGVEQLSGHSVMQRNSNGWSKIYPTFARLPAIKCIHLALTARRVLGCAGTLVLSYWGPRKLEEWREKRAEERIHGPRKQLLQKLLEDEQFEWRRLSTLARATGTTEEECRRLLIEIGARGSLSEDEELWALLSRKPITEQ